MFRDFCAFDTLEVECEFFKFEITYNNCNGYIERALKMFQIVLHKTTFPHKLHKKYAENSIVYFVGRYSVQDDYLKKSFSLKRQEI